MLGKGRPASWAPEVVHLADEGAVSDSREGLFGRVQGYGTVVSRPLSGLAVEGERGRTQGAPSAPSVW